MASMRRGGAADCARPVAGIIASSRGSPRPTAMPRSIVRREMVFVLSMVFLRSLISEEIARNDPVDDVADAVTGAPPFVEHFLHLFTIRKADRGAGGVG